MFGNDTLIRRQQCHFLLGNRAAWEGLPDSYISLYHPLPITNFIIRLLFMNRCDSIPLCAESSAITPRCDTSTDAEMDGSACELIEPLSNLSDLSDYIPLGCLILSREAITDGSSQCTSDWREITSVDNSLDVEPSLAAAVARLIEAGWIKVCCNDSSIFRCYILPHDNRRLLNDRRNRKLISCLEVLLPNLVTDRDAWEGLQASGKHTRFDRWASSDPGSLFYHFNQIPSPKPDPDLVNDKYYREALEDLLEDNVPGLRSSLYPYQRKSAGLMLQREAAPQLELDPCLDPRLTPDGKTTFYYDACALQFFKDKRYYETSRGGVLSEIPGLGKTVICLALILATKSLFSHVPPNHALKPTRESVGRLTEMAISATHRNSVPWKVEMDRMRHARNDMTCFAKYFEAVPAHYEIPSEPKRHQRRSYVYAPPPRKMIIASTTVIVVPRNLCKQWQSEIRKHVDCGMLQVLVMDDAQKVLPAPEELCKFDIVLFSRSRFELEDRHGQDNQKRRMTPSKSVRKCECPYIGSSRERDCTCVTVDMLYDSPLRHIHFKRFIIDEGHFFGGGSSANSMMHSVSDKLVIADHRWIVSGTPAKDLLGIEVDITATEDFWSAPDTRADRDLILQQRKAFSREDEKGAIDSLGLLARNFLKIKPWSEEVKWRHYIFRHEAANLNAPTGYSRTLRRFLETNVVKTRPEDVERDIELPPLKSSVIRLTPSFFDKITANLFAQVLTTNAVTSERSDADYLFHPSSHKERRQLIANLRQSAFFWTGISEQDVLSSVGTAEKYLAKHGTICTNQDRSLLNEVIQSSKLIVDSAGWRSLSRSHELGIFVCDWPEQSAEHWAFDETRDPLMIGVTQLLEAQSLVNRRLEEVDPAEGLSGAGIKALAKLQLKALLDEPEEIDSATDGPSPGSTRQLSKMSGIPRASIAGEPQKLKRAPSSAKSRNAKRECEVHSSEGAQSPSDADVDASSASNPVPTSRPPAKLPDDLAKTSIIGTASAKLSYLVSQILKHYQSEKILVFYQGDNSAYYIAQILELLDIKHEIYAKSLRASMKSDYVVRFNESDDQRVLLMDVNQAAFGLNLSSASRIYFVNPVCRPSVEAQAIKRAHRIGQTRPVFVETLVLKDSIEDKMLERSKRMTSAEHNNAKVLEDDGGIREIIQNAHVLPITHQEQHGSGRMAPLDEPQQLWGLPNSAAAQNARHDFKQSMTIRTMDATRSIKPALVVDDEVINRHSYKRNVDVAFDHSLDLAYDHNFDVVLGHSLECDKASQSSNAHFAQSKKMKFVETSS
jgi:hypothetical protein